jgi:peptidoglycan/LPS O-acetylase OafA/YrhL
MTQPPSRLSTLDALRGLAALAVCWYHFTQGNPVFLPDGWLKASGSFGWLGVEVFFVISGFIIPYALQRSGYRLSDYGTFILKRIIRLDPPYLVAILAVIVLGYASTATPGFRGPKFDPSIAQVILHLGYVNVFFGYPWLNPVFWTLAIELQYYLMVGLIFPVIASRSHLVRASSLGCLAALALSSPADKFIFHWLFLFMLGMAAFQLHASILKRKDFIVWLALLGCGAWYVNGLVIALTGIATALMLGLVEIGLKRPLLFLGHISYSLYLLHVPIGGRVINLSLRFVTTMSGKVLVLALAVATTIAAAWLLHKYVERPAQQWSSAIRYRKRRDTTLELTPVTPVSAEATLS